MQVLFGFLVGIIFMFLLPTTNAPDAPEVGDTTRPPAHTETVSTISESTAPDTHAYFPVLKVIDGDTLTIDKDGTPTTLRLIGLDTPESSTTRTGSIECFGREATDYARALFSGTSVAIETDDTQDTYDRYGRLLVYAYLPDGTLINKKMIEDGYGHEYTYREPYRFQAEFKTAESAAREVQRGLWAPGACPAAIAPASQSAATAAAMSGDYVCSKNTYNCSSFPSQASAQAAFDACGGSANDIHKLDGNGDGEVCESLQ